MPSFAEYTKPRALVVHNPKYNTALKAFKKDQAKTHNFISVPDWDALLEEFRAVVTTIKSYGIEVIELNNIVDEESQAILNQNPNSIFMRDPITTLPWSPDVAIVSNMTLEGRKSEPAISKKALQSLGIKHFFEPTGEAHVEGGDLLAISQNGKRTLFVGNADRSNEPAAAWLAKQLITAGHLDELVCIQHNRAMLHLDTCLAILPNHVVVCAEDAFRDGFVIKKDLSKHAIQPGQYLRDQGYEFIRLDQKQAEKNESCNLLFLGDNKFLSFQLSKTLAIQVQDKAKIELVELEGHEISKANGGVHCLTCPLY